jgi:hypothetical protein
MTKSNKGQVSIKQLKGFLYKPGRKPVSIEEMDEGIMRAVAKANAPPATRPKKR